MAQIDNFRHAAVLALDQNVVLSRSIYILPFPSTGSGWYICGYSLRRPSSMRNVSAYALDGTDSGSTNKEAASILIGRIVDLLLASSTKKSSPLRKVTESVRRCSSSVDRSARILRNIRSTCSSLGPYACRSSR